MKLPTATFREKPQTDMQARLRVIQEECTELISETDLVSAVSKLADMVIYLAMIVEKHLKTGEQ